MIARARFGWKPGMMIVTLALAALPAAAQQPQEARLDSLSRRVANVESDVESAASGIRALADDVRKQRNDVRELQKDAAAQDDSSGVLLVVLIGAFCALWAQNTGRNPWLWFFLGVFFHWITLLVLLAKNAGDRTSLPPPSAAPVPLPASTG
ncbi:MAG TPA: hypothetical protein VGC13_12105 [Longimicrobium sp.]|jgi:Flp pilus assembly protein TadB|uniref:hypothetical protein n=1 Tax=Longimicrobium sp. TaxID=2029185 RepID=UPI002EDA53DA